MANKSVIRDAYGRIQKGSGSNGGGRPAKEEVDARGELASQLWRKLRDDFDTYGEDAIRDCREQSPVNYLRIIAHILPKDIRVSGQVEVTYVDLLKQVQARVIESAGDVIEGELDHDDDVLELAPEDIQLPPVGEAAE